jgi:hypothetical protein
VVVGTPPLTLLSLMGCSDILEQIGETEIKLELAAVIPERELWLYKNPETKSLLEIGLEQAKSKQFSSSPPDLDADQMLADQLED